MDGGFHLEVPEEQRRAAIDTANEGWVTEIDPQDFLFSSEEGGVEKVLEEEEIGEAEDEEVVDVEARNADMESVEDNPEETDEEASGASFDKDVPTAITKPKNHPHNFITIII